MPYCKKIVILSSLDKSDLKGVLSLEQNGVKLKCGLKTYGKTDLGELVIGVKVGGSLLSPINVLESKNQNFNFELNNNLDLSQDVSVIVCKKVGGDVDAILYGGSEPEETVVKAFSKEVINYGRVGVVPKKALDEVAVSNLEQTKLFETSDDEIEAIVDSEFDKIDNHLENYNSNALKLESEVLDVEQPIFFNLVEEQVQKMFETYPEDIELSELIPNGRFAKVDFDGEGLYYSLGLIYNENGVVERICYAVKAKPNQQPPEDIKDYCFYLPANEEDGYYVLLQDAKTGENILKSDF